MLGLPAPFVPHSASLSPATATRVLSTLVPVSAPPTSLGEWLFSIFLVLVPLAVRFSVSSGCARRRSVSTYAAILVLLIYQISSLGLLIFLFELIASELPNELLNLNAFKKNSYFSSPASDYHFLQIPSTE